MVGTQSLVAKRLNQVGALLLNLVLLVLLLLPQLNFEFKIMSLYLLGVPGLSRKAHYYHLDNQTIIWSLASYKRRYRLRFIWLLVSKQYRLEWLGLAFFLLIASYQNLPLFQTISILLAIISHQVIAIMSITYRLVHLFLHYIVCVLFVLQDAMSASLACWSLIGVTCLFIWHLPRQVSLVLGGQTKRRHLPYESSEAYLLNRMSYHPLVSIAFMVLVVALACLAHYTPDIVSNGTSFPKISVLPILFLSFYSVLLLENTQDLLIDRARLQLFVAAGISDSRQSYRQTQFYAYSFVLSLVMMALGLVRLGITGDRQTFVASLLFATFLDMVALVAYKRSYDLIRDEPSFFRSRLVLPIIYVLLMLVIMGVSLL